MSPIVTTDRPGYNHVWSNKKSFNTIICNCLFINASNFVNFHYVTQSTLTVTVCYTHYQGRAKDKMLGSLPLLKVQQHIWTLCELPKFDSAKTHISGRRRNPRNGKGGDRLVGKNCARTCFLVKNPVLPGFGWIKNTTEVFLDISKILGRSSFTIWVFARAGKGSICKGKWFNRKQSSY